MRYFVLLTLLITQLAWSAPITTSTTHHPIRVVYFHQDKSAVLNKLSVAVWAAAAKTIGLNYILLPTTNLNSAIDLLDKSKVDFIIGPIHPNLNNTQIAYLNSYIPYNLAVLLPNYSKLNSFEKIWYLLKAFVGYSFAIILLYMLIFSVLIWITERKGRQAIFPRDPIRGVATAFWFTITTFTTVGYGDFIPKTRLGRTITVIWIFISLILGSTFIATMSSEANSLEQQANNIHSSGQLHGQTIAYLQDDLVTRHAIYKLKAIALPCADWKMLLNAVKNKQANAALASNILLRQYLTANPDATLRLANFVIPTSNFSFASTRKNPYRTSLIDALYTLETTGEIQQIIDKTTQKQ